VIVALVARPDVPVAVGKLGSAHTPDEFGGTLDGEYVQQARPVDESELLDGCGGAVGEERGPADSIRTMKRRGARDGLECREGLCGGDPVAARPVGVPPPFFGRPAESGGMIGGSESTGYEGRFADVRDRIAEPFVGYDVDSRSAVKNERAIA